MYYTRKSSILPFWVKNDHAVAAVRLGLYRKGMGSKLVKISKYLLQSLLIVLVYFASAKLGLSLAGATKQVTLVWPPTGIALFVLFVFGLNKWPAVALGAFLANITTDETFQIAGGIAIGNTLEAVVGAYLLKRFNFNRFFHQTKDVFVFVFFAVLLSTTVSATLGVSSLIYGGIGAWSHFFPVWLTWWVGDAIGSIIVAPFLFTWWVAPKKRPLKFSRVIESLFVFILLTGAGLLLFTDYLGSAFSSHPFSFEYAIMPVLIWIAFRFRHKGSSLAVVLISAISIWGTINNAGPFFVPESFQRGLLLLQSFVGTLALTFLIFASLVEERQRSNEKVEASERRFRALVENSYDAITLIDEKGTIVYSSPSNLRVLGYTPDEVYGKNAFTLIHPEDRAYTQKILGKIISSPGESVKAEYRILHKDGNYRYAEGIGTNLLKEPGVGAVVVNFRDITERKRVEESKGEFVSLAAHQLRAPVSTMRWYIETLMAKKEVNPKKRDGLMHEIYKAILRMNSLIDLLLNISRVELGTLKAEEEKVDVVGIAKEALKEFGQLISEKKLEIVESYEESPTFLGDPKIILIILENLVSNAVKYSNNEGRIEISVKKDTGGVLFSIKDSGVGIPRHQQTMVFTKLFRADNVKKDFPDSMGLGLYLVKSLVDMMGAEIWFESGLNKGTTFFVKFPENKLNA